MSEDIIDREKDTENASERALEKEAAFPDEEATTATPENGEEIADAELVDDGYGITDDDLDMDVPNEEAERENDREITGSDDAFPEEELSAFPSLFDDDEDENEMEEEGLPIFGASESLIDRLLEDPAVEDADPEVVASSIQNRSIRERAMDIVRKGENPEADLLQLYARATWGFPWTRRTVWLGSEGASLALASSAFLVGTTISVPLLTASFATVFLGAYTKKYAERYRSVRAYEMTRGKGYRSIRYESYLRTLKKNVEAEKLSSEGKRIYMFAAEDMNAMKKASKKGKENGGEKTASDTAVKSSEGAETSSKRHRSPSAKELQRAFYSPDTAETKVKALKDMGKAMEKGGFGKEIDSLVIEYSASPNTKDGKGKKTAAFAIPMFTIPCTMKDGIETGIVMRTDGIPEVYASAVAGQFGSEEETREKEKEAIASLKAEGTLLRNAEKRAKQLRKEIYNIMDGRSPSSGNYEKWALKKTKVQPYDPSMKEVKSPSAKDTLLLLNDKGFEYLRAICKDRFVRAGGPERRRDGVSFFIAPTKSWGNLPWGAGTMLDSGMLDKNLKNEVTPKPGKNGQPKYLSARPAPGKKPYSITIIADYPTEDGKRGSYESHMLLSNDTPHLTFSEIEGLNILTNTTKDMQKELIGKYGLPYEADKLESLDAKGAVAVTPEPVTGRVLSEGAEHREEYSIDSKAEEKTDEVTAEAIENKAEVKAPEMEPDVLPDMDITEESPEPMEETAPEKTLVRETEPVADMDNPIDFLKASDTVWKPVKGLDYSFRAEIPGTGRRIGYFDTEEGKQKVAKGDGNSIILHEADTEDTFGVTPEILERLYGRDKTAFILGGDKEINGKGGNEILIAERMRPDGRKETYAATILEDGTPDIENAVEVPGKLVDLTFEENGPERTFDSVSKVHENKSDINAEHSVPERSDAPENDEMTVTENEEKEMAPDAMENDTDVSPSASHEEKQEESLEDNPLDDDKSLDTDFGSIDELSKNREDSEPDHEEITEDVPVKEDTGHDNTREAESEPVMGDVTKEARREESMEDEKDSMTTMENDNIAPDTHKNDEMENDSVPAPDVPHDETEHVDETPAPDIDVSEDPDRHIDDESEPSIDNGNDSIHSDGKKAIEESKDALSDEFQVAPEPYNVSSPDNADVTADDATDAEEREIEAPEHDEENTVGVPLTEEVPRDTAEFTPSVMDKEDNAKDRAEGLEADNASPSSHDADADPLDSEPTEEENKAYEELVEALENSTPSVNEKHDTGRTFIAEDGSHIVRISPVYRRGVPTGAAVARVYSADNGKPFAFEGETTFENFRDGIPDTFIVSGKDTPRNIDLRSGWYQRTDDEAFVKDLNNERTSSLSSPDGNTILAIRDSEDGKTWEGDKYIKGEDGLYRPDMHYSGTRDEESSPEAVIPGYSDFSPCDKALLDNAVTDARNIEDTELNKNVIFRESGEEKPYPGYELDPENGKIILTGVISRDKVEAAIRGAGKTGGNFNGFVLADTKMITVDAFSTADDIGKRYGYKFTSLADINSETYGLVGVDCMQISPFAMLENLEYVHFDTKVPDFGLMEKGVNPLPLFRGHQDMKITLSNVDEIPSKAFSDCTIKAIIDNSVGKSHIIDFGYEAVANDDPLKHSAADRKKTKDGKSTATWRDYQTENDYGSIKEGVTGAEISDMKALFHSARSAATRGDRVLIRDAEKLERRYASYVLASMLAEYRASDDFRAKAEEAVPELKDLHERMAVAQDDNEKEALRKDEVRLLSTHPEIQRIVSEYASRSDTFDALMVRLGDDRGYQRLLRSVEKAEKRTKDIALYETHLAKILEDPELKEAGKDGKTYLYINNIAQSNMKEGAFRGRGIHIAKDDSAMREIDRISAMQMSLITDARRISGSDGKWEEFARLIPSNYGGLTREKAVLTERELDKALRTHFASEADRADIKGALLRYRALGDIKTRIENGEVIVRARGTYTGKMAMQNSGLGGVWESEEMRNHTKEIAKEEERISDLRKRKTDAEKKGEKEKADYFEKRIREANKRIEHYKDPNQEAVYARWAFAGNSGLRFSNNPDYKKQSLFSGCAPRMTMVLPGENGVREKDNRFRKNKSLSFGNIAKSTGIALMKGISGARNVRTGEAVFYIGAVAAIAVLLAFLKIAKKLAGKLMTKKDELDYRARTDAIRDLKQDVRIRFRADGIDIEPAGKLTRSDRKEYEARIKSYEELYRTSPELSALIMRQDNAAENELLKSAVANGIRFDKETLDRFKEASRAEDDERNRELGPDVIETVVSEVLGDKPSKEKKMEAMKEPEKEPERSNTTETIKKKDDGGRDR